MFLVDEICILQNKITGKPLLQSANLLLSTSFAEAQVSMAQMLKTVCLRNDATKLKTKNNKTGTVAHKLSNTIYYAI